MRWLRGQKYLLHKFGGLSSIPATYVKVEGEKQLHKLSSDLHAVTYEQTIINKIFKILSIGVWVYVGLCRSQRHKIAFEAGVPGGCEPTDVCAEN